MILQLHNQQAHRLLSTVTDAMEAKDMERAVKALADVKKLIAQIERLQKITIVTTQD